MLIWSIDHALDHLCTRNVSRYLEKRIASPKCNQMCTLATFAMLTLLPAYLFCH